MLQNKALARKLLCATMLSGMAFAAPSAFAQEEESAASEDTITVTGTRIQSANLVATSPVTTIDQFVGLKTRIVPVPLHKAIWEAVGVSPVGLPYGEVYGALETKVIDAVEINVSSMLGENLWEVGKHFTLTGHYPWHSTTAIAKDVFDSLDADLQEAMREAGRQSVIDTLAYTKEQDLTGRDELKKKGVEIFELEGLDKVREKVSPIVGQWSEKSPLIAEFVAAARA